MENACNLISFVTYFYLTNLKTNILNFVLGN